MKKLLAIFCIFTASSGLFAPKAAAQFYWSLNSQFSTQLFSRQTPLGERAEKIITVDNQNVFNEYINNNPPNPNNMVPFGVTRGIYSYFTETQNFFGYGRGDWGMPNQLRLTLGYNGDNIEFNTRVYLDRLVRINEYNANEGIGKDDFFADAGDQSFIAGDGKTPNWSAILRYCFEEWYFRGQAGFLSGYVGITTDRGKTETFNNQSDTLLKGLQVEAYGVLAPTADADFVHEGLDTNNLLRSGSPDTANIENKYTSMPYFMIAANFGELLSFPLTIQAAVDPGNNSGIGSEAGYRSIHGAFRVSGEKIAERINFDAIYKIAGGDPILSDDYDSAINPFGALQPSGDGFLIHNFGVYANILNVGGFGFGLGYSAYLKTFEGFKQKDTGAVIPKTSPMFSGFDLRIQYSGIENLVITLFNNISYGKSDTASDNRTVIGVTGIQLPDGSMQDWFALYNSFTLVYNFSGQLSASVQFAHRNGIINTEISSSSGDSTIERSRRQFGGGAYVAYKFSWFDLQLGFALRRLYQSYSNSGTPPVGSTLQIAGFRDASGGTFDIAIPIQLSFHF